MIQKFNIKKPANLAADSLIFKTFFSIKRLIKLPSSYGSKRIASAIGRLPVWSDGLVTSVLGFLPSGSLLPINSIENSFLIRHYFHIRGNAFFFVDDKKGGQRMPIIQITMLEGRDQETIETCLRNVARTVHESLGAPLSSIRIVVNEVPANRFAVGDVLKSEMQE
jgi:4-oxalocrotonate tautomerase